MAVIEIEGAGVLSKEGHFIEVLKTLVNSVTARALVDDIDHAG